MSMPALRVAFYARVSSDQQTEQGTIASQVAALEARILQDGLPLEPDHRFIDEGYSGATLIRPALERLRDAVAAGTVDRVYVHSPDRLARRYAYQVLLIDEFRRLGVEIVFLNRAIGVSPEDDLLLQVQGMVAEYERAKILERSRRGKRRAARRGQRAVDGALRLPLHRQAARRRRGPLRGRRGRGGGGPADVRVARPRPGQHRRGLPPPAAGRPSHARRGRLAAGHRVAP